jgi:hypothetical protein
MFYIFRLMKIDESREMKISAMRAEIKFLRQQIAARENQESQPLAVTGSAGSQQPPAIVGPAGPSQPLAVTGPAGPQQPPAIVGPAGPSQPLAVPGPAGPQQPPDVPGPAGSRQLPAIAGTAGQSQPPPGTSAEDNKNKRKYHTSIRNIYYYK